MVSSDHEEYEVRIEFCTVNGDIYSGAHGVNIGSLLGYSETLRNSILKITNCSSLVNMAVSNSNSIGGFCGGMVCHDKSSIIISKCSSLGNCSSVECEFTGGFCGSVECYDNAVFSINQCYSTGNISNEGNYIQTAGFCCDNNIYKNGYLNIQNCYSTCDVFGMGDGMKIAGFCSSIGHKKNIEINNCYCNGKVVCDGNVGGYGNVSGFYSGNEIYAEKIINCVWDIETSGILESIAGSGKTTSEMKTKKTFTDAGWDFDTTWSIDGLTNNGYPFLQKIDYTDVFRENNNIGSFEINVWPNPFHDHLFINFSSEYSANYSIELYDLFGIRVKSIFEGMIIPGSHEFEIDNFNLPSGIYILKFISGKKSRSVKVVLDR